MAAEGPVNGAADAGGHDGRVDRPSLVRLVEEGAHRVAGLEAGYAGADAEDRAGAVGARNDRGLHREGVHALARCCW